MSVERIQFVMSFGNWQSMANAVGLADVIKVKAPLPGVKLTEV